MTATWWRRLHGRLKLLSEILLGRAGLRRDFVGYEALLRHIEVEGLWKCEGDILEIGAFMGGGTRRLAEAARAHGKNVVVVDAFDPGLDDTANERGERMSTIYRSILGPRDLRDIFERTVSGYSNIVVYAQDSRTLQFDDGQLFAFTFIDGGHAAQTVQSDFLLAWLHTVDGGTVAFHDYGGDLPSVTETVDGIRRDYAGEIESVKVLAKRRLIFIEKREA